MLNETNMTYKPERLLRFQPFEQPAAVGLQAVAQAIVQSAWAALPEFQHGGNQPVTAPLRRHGNIMVGVLAAEFLETLFQ